MDWENAFLDLIHRLNLLPEDWKTAYSRHQKQLILIVLHLLKIISDDFF
jgi:hypothetical protein